MLKEKYKRSRGGIAYHNDFVHKVVEVDDRFTHEQASVFIKFLFQHTKILIKDPKRHSIRFPHLGVFHMRIGFAQKRLERYLKWKKKNPEATRRFKERVSLLQEQIDNFNAKFETFKGNSPENKRIVSVHLKPRYLNIPAYRRGATLDELERRILKIENERRKFDF